MSDELKFSETVVLIDAAFFNLVVTDLKGYYERLLNRSLEVIDVSILTVYMALDAGITGAGNNVQFIFVYDKDSSELAFCKPSGLRTELNGVAFMCQFGEFSFASVSGEDMSSREDLFMDLLTIVSGEKNVRKLVVASFNEEYGNKVIKALNEVKEKEVIQFRMNEPEESVQFKWEILAFPLMRALGIKSGEL